MKKTTSGFTIVELLIVIVVIAILAAISIVAYTGIQERANNARVQSDLQAIDKIATVYSITNSGNYPSSGAQVQASGIKGALSSSVSTHALYCGDATGYVAFIRTDPGTAHRQFKIGTGVPITQISPRIPWSAAPLCETTPYPAIGWNQSW